MLRPLLMAALLAALLPGCGYEACNNLPVCLDAPASEVQPSGGALDASGRFGSIYLQPGQTRSVTLTIDRGGLPASDPVYLVGTFQIPTGAEPGLLARVSGIEVRGSVEPFSGETTTVTVSVPATTSAGHYAAVFRVRRVASRYPGTSGPVSLDLQVQ